MTPSGTDQPWGCHTARRSPLRQPCHKAAISRRPLSTLDCNFWTSFLRRHQEGTCYYFFTHRRRPLFMKFGHVSGGHSPLPLVGLSFYSGDKRGGSPNPPPTRGASGKGSDFLTPPRSRANDTPDSRRADAFTSRNALIHETPLARRAWPSQGCRGRRPQTLDSQGVFRDKHRAVTRACKGVRKSVLRLKWLPLVP